MGVVLQSFIHIWGGLYHDRMPQEFTIVFEVTAVAQMCFYSTRKTTKTNIPIWSWKPFPALCKTNFCAILLAFCYAIPKCSWCRCSSCGQDCTIADAPYTSRGYETKCAGSAVLAVPLYLHKELLPTAVSARTCWLDFHQDRGVVSIYDTDTEERVHCDLLWRY